jgi:hypothetical protein
MVKEGEMKKEDILRKIEAVKELVKRGATPGERAAATKMIDKLTHMLDEKPQKVAGPIHCFRIHDQRSRRLLRALLIHYDLLPFRKKGQHQTTMLARMDRTFYKDVFLPQFTDLQANLKNRLDEVTENFIIKAIQKKEPSRVQRP